MFTIHVYILVPIDPNKKLPDGWETKCLTGFGRIDRVFALDDFEINNEQ